MNPSLRDIQTRYVAASVVTNTHTNQVMQRLAHALRVNECTGVQRRLNPCHPLLQENWPSSGGYSAKLFIVLSRCLFIVYWITILYQWIEVWRDKNHQVICSNPSPSLCGGGVNNVPNFGLEKSLKCSLVPGPFPVFNVAR